MAVVNYNQSNAVVFKNATGMTITPYVRNQATGAWELGENEYDISEIMADTVSIEPEDNEVNSIDAEFRDTPLIQSISLGAVNFTCTCIDMQNGIMKNIFGWEEANDSVFAPTSYKEMFAAIKVTFADAPTIALPFVQMNSKAVISTLKTGTAQGTISGTANLGSITISNSAKNTTWAFIKRGTTFTMGAVASA